MLLRTTQTLVLTSIFFICLYLLTTSHQVAADIDHIVLSEVRIGTAASATDEFVELYNPTGSDVVVDGWKLRRKTSGDTEGNLVASLSGTIAAHGFFLVAHANYIDSTTSDMSYSTTNSIAANNTVLLYDSTSTIVDKIGIGAAATDPETTGTLDLINDGKSVERKAHNGSTTQSMITGADTLAGNGYDSDNNSNDFVLRDATQPQNTASPTETLMPTQEPTSTPTPTATPSPTPTFTPTPSPTQIPTPTPTQALPTTTPTPTTQPHRELIATTPLIQCWLVYRPWRIFEISVFIPRLFCEYS